MNPLNALRSCLAAPLLLFALTACSSSSNKTDDTAAASVPPAITTQPVGQTLNVNLAASFTAGASGTPAPTYQWYRDGMVIPGATSTTLSIGSVRPGDAGKYTFVATNSSGYAVSQEALLQVVPQLEFNRPGGVALAANGDLFVADTNNHTILKVVQGSSAATLVAGAEGEPGSADGVGVAARFAWPAGLALDGSGNLFVADNGNSTIRKIATDGTVTTVAGSPGQEDAVDGTGAAARFYHPQGVAVDGSGNLYVADTGNHTIRVIRTGNVVSTVAGTARSSGSQDGTGATAQFNSPTSLGLDATGNLYVADYGNSTIRKITAITSGAVVQTYAGSALTTGGLDGAGTAARFYWPAGIAVTSDGKVFVADTTNHSIRHIDTSGTVSTFAGLLGVSGNADGTTTAARFQLPSQLAVNALGNLVVADTGNNSVRSLTSAGIVTTIMGNPLP